MKAVFVTSRGARQGIAVGWIVSGLIVAGGWTPAAAQDEDNKLPGIYQMDADGANFRLLVKLEGKWNGSPSFSPDGKQLLFDASTMGQFNQGHIYLMPADGPADNPTDLGLGSTPAWSPDGKRIAFYIHDQNPDGVESGVWVMHVDGTERTWLCYGRAPRWSPDGKRLVLVNNPGGAGDGLYLYGLEKNESEAVVLDRTYRLIGGAAWSPDGKRLAFIGHGGGGSELVILPLVGDDLKGRVRLKGAIGWRPSWSADGKHIACWIKNQQGLEQLHRVEADTQREPQRMAHQDQGRVNSDPAWSVDGKRIVFISNR